MRAFALPCVLFFTACAARPERPTASPSALEADVAFLAAPERQGRGVGTAGMREAAAYLEGQLAALALGRPFQPPEAHGGPPKGPTYRQAFDVVTGAERGTGTTLEGVGGALAGGKEFELFSFSDDGNVQAPVVFAGFGITAPELGYDDYAGVDVSGKIVLVLAHEPRERDQASPFRNPAALRYREVRYKAMNAREHGAKAILIAPDALQHDTPEGLPALQGSRSASAGILAAALSLEGARKVLGRSADELAKGIVESGKPASRAVGSEATFAVQLVKQRSTAENVCGAIPGTDPRLKDEWVVAGAHYDHLGLGGEFSLAPDETGKVHPGADDNASGTAAVLEIARELARHPARRSVLACFFTGEEMGLLGSSHLVKEPPMPLERVAAMVNLDMVGRLRDRKLQVFGVDTAPELRGLAEAVNGGRFALTMGGDGYGPSDHTSFYAAGIPVLFLFTGAHTDYHRPTDTAERINAAGLAEVATYAADLVRALADRTERPQVVRSSHPAPTQDSSGGGGYGAYFGSIPDFTERSEPGVLISGVRDGSPAAQAGLSAGDVIVRFAGLEIRDLYDLTYALRAHRAGDEVEVVFVHAGEKRTARATLAQRH